MKATEHCRDIASVGGWRGDALTIIQTYVPSIICMQDRNPCSVSFGCFDREYWSWKAKDMPNSTRQNWVYPLALAADVARARGPSDDYETESCMNAVRQGLRFFARTQRMNGSFDQVYPYENNLATTAYAMIGPLKAYMLPDVIDSNAELIRDLDRCFLRGRDFLLCNDETYGAIANHLALCAHVSYLLWKKFSCERSFRRAQYFIDRVLSLQDADEGWFSEYGGADPCYETQTIWHLMMCNQLFNDGRVVEACTRSVDNFLSYCIHPDCTIGGSYGRRNNSIYYSSGLRLLAKYSGLAGAVALRMSRRENNVGCLDIDNRLRYMLSVSDLLTCEPQCIDIVEKLPCEAPLIYRSFARGGLEIFGNENYYAVLSLQRGGTLCLWDKDGMVRHECHGYALRDWHGEWSSSNAPGALISFASSNGSFDLVSGFCGLRSAVLTASKHIALRLLAHSVFRVPFVSRWLKKKLIILTQFGRSLEGVFLNRKIIVNEKSVVIQDNVVDNNDTVKFICSAENVVPFHSVVAYLGSMGEWVKRYHSMNEAFPSTGSYRRTIQIEC